MLLLSVIVGITIAGVSFSHVSVTSIGGYSFLIKVFYKKRHIVCLKVDIEIAIPWAVFQEASPLSETPSTFW